MGIDRQVIIRENKVRQLLCRSRYKNKFMWTSLRDNGGYFQYGKWRSIAAGMSCLSMLFATGAVNVSASDEITEIPEQSIVYWSMWEEDEPQADVIREAAEAYEEATGISVEIQWKGRGIRSLIEPALDAGEQIDLFDDDYQRMAQEHRDYLAELKGMADTVDYEKHIMPVLLEQVKNWGNGELLAMPYQLISQASGIIRIYGKRLDLQNRISRIPGRN